MTRNRSRDTTAMDFAARDYFAVLLARRTGLNINIGYILVSDSTFLRRDKRKKRANYLPIEHAVLS